jgi:signal peptidase I
MKISLMEFGEFILNTLIVIGLAMLIRTYVASPFHVYGPSMCNTLNYIDNQCDDAYGDLIVVNEFIFQNFFGWQVSEPKMGDVIVFRPTEKSEDYYVKRVIGLPGDKIKVEGGYVYKFTDNEYVLLDESTYLNEDSYGQTLMPQVDQAGVFEVPEGRYFVMGDNRNRSTDSRSCFSNSFGGSCLNDDLDAYVPIERIRGKASLVIWPFENIQHLGNPYSS